MEGGSVSNTKVVVVGGGLVGALQACYMAKRGFEVHLFEYRKDIRLMEHVQGRSINLAMSVRGITSLNGIGLGRHIAEEYGIPMYARMIHNLDGSTYPIPYGKDNQCIYSVGRRYINEILLTAGEKYPNLHYHFEHKLVDIDLSKPEIVFQRQDNQIVKETADMVFGCDGAFSNVRKVMMKKPYFNYQQEYIPHAYLELAVDPIEGGSKHAMPPNYLHIWPRGQFMMIALPNQDKSFTVTLFMPTTTFDRMKTGEDVLGFFLEYFPDAIAIIGKEKLVRDFFHTKPAPLISIKCFPYNWEDKCVILGDAAHAMVPFYGQGMNCGMEDVLVLDGFMKQYPDDRLKAFNEYSSNRNPDAEAMVDLARYNYIEMRDLVNHTSFLLRKKLDNFLYWLLPKTWIPLYTTVTFSRMRYSQCIANKKWQDQLLNDILKWGLRFGLAGSVGIIILARQGYRPLDIRGVSTAVQEFLSKVSKPLK